MPARARPFLPSHRKNSPRKASTPIMGGLLVPVVLALAVSGPACGQGKPVLAVSYRVQNDVDTGVKGNTWAFDSYTREVRVWRKARGRFCSVSSYDGEFSSIE